MGGRPAALIQSKRRTLAVEQLPPLARFRSPPSPLRGAGERRPHHMPTATRTMTGQRMTMNSTGKMHTIIGTESLAGKL